MTMQCVTCNGPFASEDNVAAMSGSIMGDEHTDVYYLCPVCRVYTVVSYWDDFTGVESMNVSGPVPLEEGNARVEQIRKCSCPWDKKCRCDAHRAYFNDTLD